MNISSSLNDILQLWMTCPATKLLMEMATECFAAMSVSASWVLSAPLPSVCLPVSHSVLFVFLSVLFVFLWACIDPVLSACVSQHFVNMMLNVHRNHKAY